MTFLIPVLGIIFAFILIKYREQIGDVFGDPDWMRPLGGVYFVIVYIAIFIIFWSIAYAHGHDGHPLQAVPHAFPHARSQRERGAAGFELLRKTPGQTRRKRWWS
jgi:hypothetical protein